MQKWPLQPPAQWKILIASATFTSVAACFYERFSPHYLHSRLPPKLVNEINL